MSPGPSEAAATGPLSERGAVGGGTPAPFVTTDLETATLNSDAVYAHTRQFASDEGSITVLFRRADNP
jgi:hypothetical protein